MFAVVILAGGAARRVGGATKPALRVGGRPLLNRVLDAVVQAQPRIVVGPPDLAGLLPPDVTLTRESPPGGGPVAATAAGLELLAHLDPTDHVGVFASDLPFLSPGAVNALLVADDLDGRVLVDDDDRPQWLAGIWRLGALVQRLAILGDPAGRSMRALTSGLRVAPIRLADLPGPPAWFDCDSEDDLRRAEEWADGDGG